jgi:hypothetical protein
LKRWAIHKLTSSELQLTSLCSTILPNRVQPITV